MSSQPKISVVITNYNYGLYISEAIQSVYNQEYDNIELIIIDDGSTDDSNTVIQGWLTKHPEIRYINQPNEGIVLTRNKALECITGDYLCFLDADDRFPREYLVKLVSMAEQHQLDVVYADMQRFGNSDTRMVMPEFDLDIIVSRNCVNISALVRISAIGKHRFDVNLQGLTREDWDFFLGLALSGAKFSRCADTVIEYRDHGNSRENGDVSIAEERNNAVKFIHMYYYIIAKYHALYPDIVDFSANSEMVDMILQSKYSMQANKRYADLEQQFHIVERDRDALQDANSALRQSLNSVLNSKRYKLGSLITWPLDKWRQLRHN